MFSNFETSVVPSKYIRFIDYSGDVLLDLHEFDTHLTAHVSSIAHDQYSLSKCREI